MRSRLAPLLVLVFVAAGTSFAASGAAEPARQAKSAGNDGRPPAITEHVSLIADLDDDDADERADGLEELVAPAARVDALTLDARFAGATLLPTQGAEHARILGGGKTVGWGEKLPAGAQLQGLSPGHAAFVLRWAGGRETGLAVDVHGVTMRDAAKNPVDMATSHASLERTPPARVDANVDAAAVDPDALRIILTSPADAPPLGPVSVETIAADGASLDAMPDMHLEPCGAGPRVEERPGLVCAAGPLVRYVVDDVDRKHALVAERSLKAEVGGAIVVRDAKGKKLQAIRVAGPRNGEAGALGRYKLAIRPVVMRLSANGGPSIGGTDAGAVASVRQELAAASGIWGQCGLAFGGLTDVKVVSPPPPYLVALGDDVGLPASGGEVKLKIEGKPVAFKTKAGWSTRQAALELQRVADKQGFKAALSENARISSGAAPSVDVAMRRPDGQLAKVELVSSSDTTMAVSIGVVDLTDGLQHFGDTDSVAGTLEERALVKAVDDGDPRTIEVIVIPFFGGGGRIGESFIGSDGSSMRNVVIVDRAGVRARRTSMTLAHELGHVILDEPGHPDDYGIDTPTLLMDSDASDASPFGPRRLTVDDCVRAVRQSGPSSRIPLLTEWKLGPLKYR